MASDLKGMSVRIRDHSYLYHSDFILYPFAYFDIPIRYENELLKVARAIEKRCKERFRTSELVGLRIIKRFSDRFEVRVNFTISDAERIAFQSAKKEQDGE